MKPKIDPDLEKWRVLEGDWASEPGANHGMFVVSLPSNRKQIVLMVSPPDGQGWPEHLGLPAWEHVSVSLRDRCPTWEEMCWAKRMFFEPHECVVQFHPPAVSYINKHPFTLHLWKPVGLEIPTPPTDCV